MTVMFVYEYSYKLSFHSKQDLSRVRFLCKKELEMIYLVVFCHHSYFSS